MTKPRTMTYGFYNFAPPNEGRTTATLAEDTRAIANRMPNHPKSRKPLLLGGVECVGWGTLPVIHGMKLLRSVKTPSRANVCLYVDRDLDLQEHEYVDMKRTWPATEHPGMHDPRSALFADINDWRVIVGHAPPRTKGDKSAAARGEYVRTIGQMFNDTNRPTLLLNDDNGLTRQIQAEIHRNTWVAGSSPDTSISTEPNEGDNFTGIFGVKMRSDHKSFLFGKTVARG